MLGLDVLVNIANVVYLWSYSVRDIFWLRVLTVLAGGLLLPYYYLQASPLWLPIGWNVFFIGINLFWITLLLSERRPVPFTDEERRLYDLAMPNLSEREAYKFLELARRDTIASGTELLTQGEPVKTLSLIVGGTVTVGLDGHEVDRLGEGSFLGSIAYLNNDAGFSAPVTVRATEGTTLLQWDFKTLDTILAANPHLRIGLEASLGLEIATWLKTARLHMIGAAPA